MSYTAGIDWPGVLVSLGGSVRAIGGAMLVCLVGCNAKSAPGADNTPPLQDGTAPSAPPVASSTRQSRTGQRATTRPPRSTPSVPLPPHYARLFELHHTFEYEIIHRSSGCSAFGGCTTNEERLKSTCRVERVSREQMRRIAYTSCEPNPWSDMPVIPMLGGVYVATPVGLWVVSDEASLSNAHLLRPDAMLISADPKEQEVERVGERHLVTKRAGGWCVSRRRWSDSEDSYEVCLFAAGITEARWFWAGGSTREVRAKLIPSSPR